MRIPKSYTHYINQFEDIKEQVQELLPPVPDEQFAGRPADGGWSAAECMSHLVESGQSYLQKINEGMDVGSSLPTTEGNDPMRVRWHIRWFVRYLEPPVSFKSKAPKSFQPKLYSDIDKQLILNRFVELQERYLEILKDGQSKKLNLAGIKTRNPVVPLISMSVAECIAITEAHQRRHLQQAANVLDLTF